MVHTELRSKASIGYTSQSCGGTPTRKVLPELPLPNSGPGMRALSPTVALPARSVEPDWSLERDHGEAHDVKQSPHPKISSAANECGWPALARYATLRRRTQYTHMAKVN
jgi:hypothetical protein